jgi:PAS domain S-box-containing protein
MTLDGPSQSAADPGSALARARIENAQLEERIRRLIETANDAVVSIDSASIIIDWNAAAESMFGWRRDEAVGRLITDVIVPEQHRAHHHAGLARFLAGALADGEGILNRRIETTGLNRDGREFDIELSVWPVRSGDSWTFSSFIRDISERKRADAALARSEERYRAVVEHANEGIVVAQDGRIRFGNRRAFELTGRTPEEAMSKPFLDMIHPDDRARVMNNYLRRIRGEPVENFYEFRVSRSDGSLRWLLISAVMIEWEGKPATLNFLSDVTEQVEMKENLQNTLAERSAILETSAVGIMFIQAGRIKWINPALEQSMLGYAQGEVIGRTGELAFRSHGDWSRFLSECTPRLSAGDTYEAEWQVVRKNGETWWCQMSGRALNPADLGEGTMWFFIDISARKRAEEEIRRALARERELSDLKTRFVSMTSHEFRTPLTAILSSVEILEDFSATMPEAERREVIGLIKSALKRMTGMLDQVLLIGRADSDKLEFKPGPLDVHAFCESLIAEIQRAGDARIDLDFGTGGAGDRRLLDGKLLHQVLTNLLSNAVKYSPGGSVPRLQLSVFPAELEFRVTDQGIGIPVEDHARLFESFHRGRNVGNIEGTGLGLTIVQQCVRLHGGSVSFDSAPGRGTTFIVKLPAPLASQV